jgi:putative hydrolases of HD superfamily
MEDLIKFLFEISALKRIKRSGWWLEGIKDPETVAEHSYRTAMIGYILAKMENANVDKVVKMCLFHDMPECRINDVPRSAIKYLNKDPIEKEVIKDQAKLLPDFIGRDYEGIFAEMDEGKTKEAVVAKDADRLETIIQAKEYSDMGFKGCDNWVEKNSTNLQTESAKKIVRELKRISFNEWHVGMAKPR